MLCKHTSTTLPLYSIPHYQHSPTNFKMEEKNEEDRISELSDCILLLILSFINSKQAVQSSILSKRWIHLWKFLTTFNMVNCYSFFKDYQKYQQFTFQFFKLRDHSSAIHTLDFCRNINLDPTICQNVLNYALSHNVQHLLVDYTENVEPEPFAAASFLSCHTLKSLYLEGPLIYWRYSRIEPKIFPNNIMNLPALTHLSLKYFVFGTNDDIDGCVNPFSSFNMLNSLIIDSCMLLNKKNLLCISSDKLVNLTMIMPNFEPSPFSMETNDDPYILKIKKKAYFGFKLYAPSLHTFAYTGCKIKKVVVSNPSSIKHVNLCFKSFYKVSPKTLKKTSVTLLHLLFELASIESLTVYKAIEVLSLVPNLSKVEFTSLCNLKSLEVRNHIPLNLKSKTSEVVDFLIQNSPSAKVDYMY